MRRFAIGGEGHFFRLLGESGYDKQRFGHRFVLLFVFHGVYNGRGGTLANGDDAVPSIAGLGLAGMNQYPSDEK
jgi:hypothetical protein